MIEGTRPLVWRPGLEKVLIVHASTAFRAGLRCKMNAAGFDCIEAGDVLAGLQRAVEDRPDAVIVDASLGSLGGAEMRSILAGNPATRHLPVLLCDADVRSPEQALYAASVSSSSSSFVSSSASAPASVSAGTGG